VGPPRAPLSDAAQKTGNNDPHQPSPDITVTPPRSSRRGPTGDFPRPAPTPEKAETQPRSAPHLSEWPPIGPVRAPRTGTATSSPSDPLPPDPSPLTPRARGATTAPTNSRPPTQTQVPHTPPSSPTRPSAAVPVKPPPARAARPPPPPPPRERVSVTFGCGKKGVFTGSVGEVKCGTDSTRNFQPCKWAGRLQ